MKRVVPVLALLLWGVAIRTAIAAPVHHVISLAETDSTLGPLQNFTGSFIVDDSMLVPNTFVPFSSVTSFTLTIHGYTLTLGDAQSPSTQGLITDAFGDVIGFQDSTAGIFIDFLLNAPPQVVVEFSEVNAAFNLYVDSGPPAAAGTFSILALPEPSDVILLTIGLAAMAIARRMLRRRLQPELAVVR